MRDVVDLNQAKANKLIADIEQTESEFDALMLRQFGLLDQLDKCAYEVPYLSVFVRAITATIANRLEDVGEWWIKKVNLEVELAMNNPNQIAVVKFNSRIFSALGEVPFLTFSEVLDPQDFGRNTQAIEGVMSDWEEENPELVNNHVVFIYKLLKHGLDDKDLVITSAQTDKGLEVLLRHKEDEFRSAVKVDINLQAILEEGLKMKEIVDQQEESSDASGSDRSGE